MAREQKQVTASIQVLIAALNEEEGIGPTISEIIGALDSPMILVVDGRSTDRTVEIAKNLGSEIYYQDGFGKGDALSKAIAKMDPAVDYVVLTDADYTYPAEYIPKMIQMLEQNPRLGMVCGNRFTDDLILGEMHDLLFFGNRLISFTHNLLNGVALNDPLTGLRVLRGQVLRSWKVKSRGFDIEVELNHQVEQQGFEIAEIPITYRQRLGQKKLGIKNGAEIFKRILLESVQEGRLK